jgi:hypothetical protein
VTPLHPRNGDGRLRIHFAVFVLTEISTRNIKIILILGGKVRRVRRADNLTAIYEPIVQTM